MIDGLALRSANIYSTFRIIMKRMVQKSSSTLLGYALLGVLHQKPASGYDVRKIFVETAMGHFSDSPGSIYPALRRLQERKLVTAQIEQGAGLRRRRILRITPAGLAELKAWLKTPMEARTVTRKLDEWMLRFSFFDGVLGGWETLGFLESFETALKAYVPPLQEFLLANGSKMSISGRLALENGLMGYETQLRWAAHAIRTYKRKVKSS